MNKANFHLPGLFEFYDFYQKFLPLYKYHREYFYDWVQIGSLYGSPKDCIWSGGRISNATSSSRDVLSLMEEYDIPACLTFSNLLLEEIHLKDKRCNEVCALFHDSKNKNGVIVASDLLLEYLKKNFPNLFYVSSTTKVITCFEELVKEVNKEDYKRVVIDFRLNKNFEKLKTFTEKQKEKIEFLCNECCDVCCLNRKDCYLNVSKLNLGMGVKDYPCPHVKDSGGYRFSRAMKNPSFIGVQDIKNQYLPMGFSNFKIEGRSLGNALLFEFLLYYMVKPEYHLILREELYLDNTLDLF